MNQTNFDIIELDKNYSTMRRVIKADPQEIAGLVKQANKPEDKFETVLFLPEGENRQGEGGLRTQGYFKVGGIIPSPLTGSTSPLTKDDPSPSTPNPSPEAKPLITVVTVVFNGEQFLEETILSVINQTYDNVEYIIIDGGSTDRTLDIIKKYEHAIDYWVSEKDEGIYDAMNKGIFMATGKLVNFLNSGDIYLTSALLVFNEINIYDSQILKFKVQVENGLVRNEIASVLYFGRRMLNHQGIFYGIDVFRKNLFDKDYKIIGDLKHVVEKDLWKKIEYYDIVLVRYAGGGLATTRKAIFQNYVERTRVLIWSDVDIRIRFVIFGYALIGLVFNFLKGR